MLVQCGYRLDIVWAKSRYSVFIVYSLDSQLAVLYCGENSVVRGGQCIAMRLV